MLSNENRLFGFAQIGQYFGRLPLKCCNQLDSHKVILYYHFGVFQGALERVLLE